MTGCDVTGCDVTGFDVHVRYPHGYWLTGDLAYAADFDERGDILSAISEATCVVDCEPEIGRCASCAGMDSVIYGFRGVGLRRSE